MTSNPEDLSARARRGLLSEVEERELRRALRANPVLRTAHAVGIDLDRSTTVQTGDEDLIARAADAALARVAHSGLARPSAERVLVRGAPSPKRRRAVAALAGAAVVFGTGMAAAMWSGLLPAPWRPHSEGTLPSPASAPRSLVVVDAPRSRVHPPKTDEPVTPLETPPAPASVKADEGTLASHTPQVRAPDASVSAAAWFRTANAARRAGQFDRAKAAYSELIARYPSSDEARLARVSLGKLLLEKGNASGAEQEFDQYLKAGHGPLAEEALVSRAQSLRKLGRTDAERRTLQRLVAEYPNSVYAAEAKGRLDALRHGAAGAAP